MNKCPTCGSDVRPGDNFCLTCGNRLPQSPSSSQQPSSLTADSTLPSQDWSAGPSTPPPVYGGWGGGDDRTIAGAGGSSSELPTVRADESEEGQPTIRADESEEGQPTIRADASLFGSKEIEHPARFVIRAPNGNIVQDYLLDKPRVVIGRVPESDISFPEDRLVSRLHATVLYEDDHYMLRDEGSANGTLVNNQPLEKSNNWTLHDGDQILIGDHELTFNAATPPSTGIEESETMIIPPGSPVEVAAQADDDKTAVGIDPLGTQTMDVANQPVASSAPSTEPSALSSSSAAPVAKPVPPAEVNVGNFGNLSQPSLPSMDALLAASMTLNEQIASLQQQLNATQEAMRNRDAEVAQTADRLRVAMRRLADRMDNTISNVARSRDEMDWNGLQRGLQDVISSPRDIGYAMEFARRAPEVDKIIQRYQGVLNTLAECNSLLRGLIGEEKT